MTEAVVEKALCENCGVDVRDNTSYCYNCGVPTANIADEPDDQGQVDAKTQAALDDLADKLKKSEEDDRKLEKAAAERRKARVKQRKSKEFAWEPVSEGTGFPLVLATALIALLSLLVVALTVFWK